MLGSGTLNLDFRIYEQGWEATKPTNIIIIKRTTSGIHVLVCISSVVTLQTAFNQ